MKTSAENPLRLGEFHIDFASGELRRNGHIVRLKPQPCKVLSLLIAHPGQTVSREEIQKEVWGGGTFVDFERGLNSCIKQIRAALSNDPDAPRYIETIPRRGYRLIAPVEPAISASDALRADATSARPSPSSAVVLWASPVVRRSELLAALILSTIAAVALGVRHGRTEPGKMRLVVLPFTNLSGDAGDDFLGDGLCEELITQIGQLAPQKLGVIARTSAGQY